MKILAFGEILWDLFPNKSCIGGAPLNFAAHAAKQGSEAYIMSALGEDDLGEEATAFLKEKNINTAYVKKSPLETGKCMVSLDEKGIPHYNLLSGVAWDDIEGEIKEDFDIFYFGTLALREDKNLNTVKCVLKNNSFKEIFVDLNIRPPFFSAKTVSFAASNATILKVSDEELPIFLEEADLPAADAPQKASEIISKKYNNLKLIIITLGEKGAFCFDVVNNKTYKTEAVKTKVVSTVGAGDSFSASFICEYMKNSNINTCLTFASKVAAFVVSRTEAIPDYPESF